MITIKDVAEKAGVSIAAVSYALNGTGSVSFETKKRILDVVKELDYVPSENARRLKQKKSKSIGLILRSFVTGFYGVLVEGASLTSQRYNVNLEVHISPLPREDLIYSIMQSNVDGFIILHSDFMDEDIWKIKKGGFPIVFLDREIREEKISSVLVNNAGGLSLVFDHLVKTGHKRIAYMRGDGCYDDKKRFEGYVNSMKKYARPIDDSLILTGGFTEYAGYYAFRDAHSKMLQLPDAICCGNDSMAWGCIRAIEELGFRVPEDISVTGFDGYFIKPENMPLTTVYNPAGQIAQKAVEEVVRLMEPGEEGRITVIEPKVLIRDSTVYRI